MEERTYPFSDSNVSRMLDDFLEKKIIKLPECKRPKEMGHTNNPKYYKYHRVVNHPVGKCFVLKDIIIRLKEGKILLDLDEIVQLNYTTFTTTSLALIKSQTLTKTQSPLTSTLGASDKHIQFGTIRNFHMPCLGPPNEAKIKGMLMNEDGSWALITQKKTGK